MRSKNTASSRASNRAAACAQPRLTRRLRQMALIALPCTKNARRIFAIVSTTTSQPRLPRIMEANVDPSIPGSRLDADHPEKGVLFACRFTAMGGVSGLMTPTSMIGILARFHGRRNGFPWT
jgi:hypothetical protein